MTWLSHNEMWEAFGTRALFWAGTGSDFGEVNRPHWRGRRARLASGMDRDG